MSTELPTYTPSNPAPTYSADPLPEERTLEHHTRARSRPQTGTFVKRSRSGTWSLRLIGLDELASTPTYGRNGIINGEIQLDNCESVLAVSIKLEGHISAEITEGGKMRTTILSEGHQLWKSDRTSHQCPGLIPFCYVFPTQFTDDLRTRPLPPSFRASFLDIPAFGAESTYTLTATIMKARAIPFFKSRQLISVTVNYHPRTRPHRPISLLRSPLSRVLKEAPEEWTQVLCQMKTRSHSGLGPIECHLFIPSVQIFGLADTIPFHLQLSAPAASLQALFPLDLPAGAVPIVRVFLLRQISAEVRGQKAWRMRVLGEGITQPVPPSASVDAVETLGWEGHVRCEEDVSTGSFNAGQIMVRDFIVLALIPPRPQQSPLLELQHAHPIRLTTDQWEDVIPESMRP